MGACINEQDLKRYRDVFESNPVGRLAMNAVTQNGISAVAIDRKTVTTTDHTYSHLVETPEATNQKRSGRCWLFSGLNTLRLEAMKKMNLETFELSQAYMMFWDKLEKANFFLENIIETRDEPLNGRLVMWLLSDPLGDGGQWDMFVNLVEKYGVVPKTAMPESFASSESRTMNGLLTARLREDASILRGMNDAASSSDDLAKAKDEMLTRFYRMLVTHLGQPPQQFAWEWRDKDKKFHRHDGLITPVEFFRQYVGVDMSKKACVINAPTSDKPFERMFTVQYLGNVVGGHPVRYLNVDIDTLKQAAIDQLVDGKAVWFGCDVGKMLERKLGIMDMDLYDYELVYGAPFALDKAGRLNYGQSQMTHAMVLTAVDLDNDGKPLKWRIENSWGTEIGDKGYMVMSDAWFDEYLYEITVDKTYLPAEILPVLETEPIVLPPWDPMGSLAR